MYRDLKPCIRCEGMGKIPIEILSPDRQEHTVAGMAKCHGCMGTGRVPVGEPPEVERVLAGATVDAKGAGG
jgi:hypothetical protein